jgi:hypothetical protein
MTNANESRGTRYIPFRHTPDTIFSKQDEVAFSEIMKSCNLTNSSSFYSNLKKIEKSSNEKYLQNLEVLSQDGRYFVSDLL